MHPSAIGRRIVIRANLDRVQVCCDSQLVADHTRVWARHQTIADPEHLDAARLLRRSRGELLRPVQADQVETRNLTDYDAALGLDGGAA